MSLFMTHCLAATPCQSPRRTRPASHAAPACSAALFPYESCVFYTVVLAVTSLDRTTLKAQVCNSGSMRSERSTAAGASALLVAQRSAAARDVAPPATARLVRSAAPEALAGVWRLAPSDSACTPSLHLPQSPTSRVPRSNPHPHPSPHLHPRRVEDKPEVLSVVGAAPHLHPSPHPYPHSIFFTLRAASCDSFALPPFLPRAGGGLARGAVGGGCCAAPRALPQLPLRLQVRRLHAGGCEGCRGPALLRCFNAGVGLWWGLGVRVGVGG